MVINVNKVISKVADVLVPGLLVSVAVGVLLFGYKFYALTNLYYHASADIQYHQAQALEAIAEELGGRKPTTASNGEETSAK